jgi:hypothetical protein
MDSRCASERNGSFFDDPHPERLSPPDRRDVTPWQPFIGAGMSSTDLNNDDYFSDYPKRLPSFDVLFRAEAQLSPEQFFRNLERQSGDNRCSQDDYLRAVFLFRRLQSARRPISRQARDQGMNVLIFYGMSAAKLLSHRPLSQRKAR